MQEEEARLLAALPKWGEPCIDWVQDRPNAVTNEFGVTDAEGRAIKSVQVEFSVFVSPRLGFEKFDFTLWRVERGLRERAYQLTINRRAGLTRQDHQYSHEHYGQNVRVNASGEWAQAPFDYAVQIFCEKTSLTLMLELPSYQEFRLK